MTKILKFQYFRREERSWQGDGGDKCGAKGEMGEAQEAEAPGDEAGRWRRVRQWQRHRLSVVGRRVPEDGRRLSDVGCRTTSGRKSATFDNRRPASGTRRVTFDNRRPTSGTRRATSDIRHPAPGVRHSTTGVRRPATGARHPTSDRLSESCVGQRRRRAAWAGGTRLGRVAGGIRLFPAAVAENTAGE